MSFSSLLLQHFKHQPQHIQDWERLNFDLQVVLSWCDGELAEDERRGLMMRTHLVGDPAEIEGRIDMWSDLYHQHDHDFITDQVFSYYRQLAATLPEPLRAPLADALFQEVLQTVLSDRVVTTAEYAFVLERMAPLLRIGRTQAEARISEAAARLLRAVRHAELAFEVYLWMWSEAGDAPPAQDLPEEDVDGFPAVVRALTLEHRLGSAHVVHYFLSLFGGVSVLEEADEHCAHLARVAADMRARQGRGERIRRRLEAILDELRADALDPAEALDNVFNHLIHIFGLLEDVPAGYRRAFKKHALAAYAIDYDALVADLEGLREASPRIYHNITGGQRDDSDQGKRWWAFWKK